MRGVYWPSRGDRNGCFSTEVLASFYVTSHDENDTMIGVASLKSRWNSTHDLELINNSPELIAICSSMLLWQQHFQEKIDCRALCFTITVGSKQNFTLSFKENTDREYRQHIWSEVTNSSLDQHKMTDDGTILLIKNDILWLSLAWIASCGVWITIQSWASW